MAVTTVNNATKPLRWENSGLIYINNSGNTTQYASLWIVPGSLKFKGGGREPIRLMDRGTNKGVMDGDERQSTIEFRVQPTKEGMTGASELVAIARPTSASGLRTLVRIEIIVPDYDGATTGTKVTIDNCYLDELPEYSAGSGAKADELTFKFVSQDAEPAYATY